MSPDQMDAWVPLLKDATPVEQALYHELIITRQEMRRGFEKSQEVCLTRGETCGASCSALTNRVRDLEEGQRVNKTRLGLLVGGGALGGGALGKLIQTMLEMFKT